MQAQKTMIENCEKMIIKEKDIFIKKSNQNKNDNGDIVIIDGDSENDNDEPQINEQVDDDKDEHDEGESGGSEDEEEKFVKQFEEIIYKLSENIRFTLMAPLFFIKIVQSSNILTSQRIIDIQNYALLK